MDKNTLRRAMLEAKKFLSRGQAVLDRAEDERDQVYTFFGCKETGACKRSSMDLTRALAAMRKSR